MSKTFSSTLNKQASFLLECMSESFMCPCKLAALGCLYLLKQEGLTLIKSVSCGVSMLSPPQLHRA